MSNNNYDATIARHDEESARATTYRVAIKSVIVEYIYCEVEAASADDAHAIIAAQLEDNDFEAMSDIYDSDINTSVDSITIDDVCAQCTQTDCFICH